MRDIDSIFKMIYEELEDYDCSLGLDRIDPFAGLYRITMYHENDNEFVVKADNFIGKHDGWEVEYNDVYPPMEWEDEDGYELHMWIRAKPE